MVDHFDPNGLRFDLLRRVAQSQVAFRMTVGFTESGGCWILEPATFDGGYRILEEKRVDCMPLNKVADSIQQVKHISWFCDA